MDGRVVGLHSNVGVFLLYVHAAPASDAHGFLLISRRQACLSCEISLWLFHAEEEVVFLSFLDEDVFVVEEQVGGSGGVDVAYFLFVD